MPEDIIGLTIAILSSVCTLHILQDVNHGPYLPDYMIYHSIILQYFISGVGTLPEHFIQPPYCNTSTQVYLYKNHIAIFQSRPLPERFIYEHRITTIGLYFARVVREDPVSTDPRERNWRADNSQYRYDPIHAVEGADPYLPPLYNEV